MNTDPLVIAEPIITRLAAKLLKGFTHADREDAAQECRLLVWRKASAFDPSRGELRAFLHTVIHNRLLDERTRLVTQRHHSSGDEHDEPAAPEGGADKLAERIATNPHEHLPQHAADLLRHLFATNTRAALAQRLGVSTHAAEMRVHRLKADILELVA